MAGYIFNFKEHGAFDPDGKVEMTQEQINKHNAQLEAQEVAYAETLPQILAGYYSEKKDDIGHDTITTWTGARLGFVCNRHCWFRSNFGDKRRNFTAKIYGAYYHGTQYENADYVTLRKLK